MHEETVTCSFCGGKGKDPFDIMSSLSTCCVCKGKGVVKVQAQAVCPLSRNRGYQDLHLYCLPGNRIHPRSGRTNYAVPGV